MGGPDLTVAEEATHRCAPYPGMEEIRVVIGQTKEAGSASKAREEQCACRLGLSAKSGVQ